MHRFIDFRQYFRRIVSGFHLLIFHQFSARLLQMNTKIVIMNSMWITQGIYKPKGVPI